MVSSGGGGLHCYFDFHSESNLKTKNEASASNGQRGGSSDGAGVRLTQVFG